MTVDSQQGGAAFVLLIAVLTHHFDQIIRLIHRKQSLLASSPGKMLKNFVYGVPNKYQKELWRNNLTIPEQHLIKFVQRISDVHSHTSLYLEVYTSSEAWSVLNLPNHRPRL